jgi:hypothetical protein
MDNATTNNETGVRIGFSSLDLACPDQSEDRSLSGQGLRT